MTDSISTNTDAITDGAQSASSALEGSAGAGATGAGIDPRLTAASADTHAESQREKDKTRDKAETAARNSKGQDGIQDKTASNISKVGTKALSALGAGASGLLGSVGKAGSGLGGAGSSMPTVPASSAGQANPVSLSQPSANNAALADILGGSGLGGSSVLGSGTGAGLTGPSGTGGSGTSGPSVTGDTDYQKKVISEAERIVSKGVPYAWGGGGPEGPSQGTSDGGGAADANGDYNKIGYDCSGLAQYLTYQGSGVELPRTSQEQYNCGTAVSYADAQPGDLVFPSSAGVPPTHVQVYVGDGKVVEAQQSGTNIMFSNVDPDSTFKRVVEVSS